MSFEPITINSQEELDAMFQERIDRAKKSEAEKYAGYNEYKDKAEKFDEEMTAKNAELAAKDEELESLKAQVIQYESDSVKTKVLEEMGLPTQFKSWITDNDEEAIRQRAAELKDIVGIQKQPAPLANPEAGSYEGDEKKAALKKALKQAIGKED